MMRRSLLASVALAAFTAVLAIHAQEPTKTSSQGQPTIKGGTGKNGQPTIDSKQIILLEQEIQKTFGTFVDALQNLSDAYGKSADPMLQEKAKQLNKILEECKTRDINRNFTQLIKFLGEQKLEGTDNIDLAVRQCVKLAGDLKDILELVRNDNGASSKRDERLALEKMLKEIDKAIREEKIVRDRIDADKDREGVAKTQGDIKDNTEKVVKKDGQGGEAKDQNAKSKEAGTGDKAKTKPGDNKKGEAGKANAKEAGKGTDKDKGESKDTNKKPGSAGKESPKGQAKEGKPSDGAKNAQSKDSKDAKGSEAGAPKDGKGSEAGKAGESKDGGKKDMPPGEKSKAGDVKPSTDNKTGDKKDKEGNSKDSKGSEASKAGASKSDNKDQKADASASKPGGDSPKSQDSKPGDSKPGDAKPGSPSQGQAKDSQPPPPGGDQAAGKSDNKPPSPPQPKDSLETTKKKIQDAVEAMQKAKDDVEAGKVPEAGKNADQAIADLEAAKKKLEDLIRQLREEELDRLLTNLIDRCQKMLIMQQQALDGTIKTHNQIEANNKKANQFAIQDAINLSDDEYKIVLEASKAIELLEGEGSAVAFPEVFRQLREDMKHVQRRLKSVDCGDFTIGLEEDICATLNDMIAALKKAKKDLDDKKNPPKKSDDSPPPPPQDQKLLEKIQELKMIKSMQMRVNDRTAKYAQQYPPGTPMNEQVQGELRELQQRQEQIIEVTNKIAKGDNQ